MISGCSGVNGMTCHNSMVKKESIKGFEKDEWKSFYLASLAQAAITPSLDSKNSGTETLGVGSDKKRGCRLLILKIRELLLSIGAFVENLVLAAEHSLRVDIKS